MDSITPAANRPSHRHNNQKPIPCSTLVTLVGLGVIFGALAGLALWKGGGLSFKNAKFSYLGFGAAGAGVIFLSAAVIVAICTKPIISKDLKKEREGPLTKKPTAPVNQDVIPTLHAEKETGSTSGDSENGISDTEEDIGITNAHAQADISPPTIDKKPPGNFFSNIFRSANTDHSKKFGIHTGAQIMQRFKRDDTKWESGSTTIEGEFGSDADFLKSVILYLLCTTKGNWTKNWGISPENLPIEGVYTPEFIEKYLLDNSSTKDILHRMEEKVRTKFVNYIINKAQKEDVTGRFRNQMLALIPSKLLAAKPLEFWPKNQEIPTAYIDSQIWLLTQQIATGKSEPNFAESWSRIQPKHHRLKYAILDRLVQLEKASKLGQFPSVSTIPGSLLPAPKNFSYSDDFMAVYLKPEVSLKEITNEDIWEKFISYIIRHKEDIREAYKNTRGFMDVFVILQEIAAYKDINIDDYEEKERKFILLMIYHMVRGKLDPKGQIIPPFTPRTILGTKVY